MDESKLIQIIVDDIFNKKYSTSSSADGKLVGMETRIRDVLSSLEIGTEDVRMIGIKGMGGGGKTTLARAVYDQISNRFEGNSFVDNVREVSQPSLSGLKKLQKQILKDVLNKNDISVSSVHDGKIMLKDMMSRRKTLVVLDDVDCIEQLEALAGEPNWFKSGSRLIITTRDEQVLLAHRVKFVHDVNLLSSTEGICLFSRYAFQTEIPTRGYEELSGQVVQYAHGLRYLGMHDHLEEMGRNIVCRSHPDEPQRHSRLWVNEEIEHILTNNLGTPETKCLYFHSPFFSAEIAMKGLAKMKELRYIDISLIAISPTIYESPDNNFFQLLELDKDSEYLPSSLRFMKWECFPFSSLPNTFQGKYLVQLEMDSSKIVQLWEDGEEKVLYKLRFLTFTFSNLRTFDLRLAPNLEQLTIDHCELFEELHIPADHHSKLECLNITCSSLRNLNLGNTSNLKTLELYGCIDLVELQMAAESLKLEHLDLSGSKLKRIHLGRTLNLEQLILDGCNDLVELQMPAESLKLEYLDLTGSKLKTIHLGRTPNLEELILDGCKNLILLLELGHVKCLKELNIQGTGLRRLPLSIFQMKGLRIIGSVEILESCGLKSKIQTSYEEIYCYM